MGGKARLFNPEKLSPLFRESIAFDKIANERLQVIQRELNRLQSHSRLVLVTGGRSGERNAASGLDEAFKALRKSLADLNRFIQRRMDVAASPNEPSPKAAAATVQTRILPDKHLKK